MNRWAVISVVGLIAIAAIYASYRGIRYAQQKEADGFRYFTYEEFDSPDAPGSGRQHMSAAFIRKLDRIREKVGLPFIITSGYRTPAHNASVGGASSSAHMQGLAADIAAPTDGMRRAIAKAAIAEGITRIGMGRTFIHLDIDKDKPQLTWTYDGSTPPSLASLA
jgi:zinc D-Ala-D-Ala carboxypeptidase